LLEFSITQKRVTYDFGEIFDNPISSIAVTFNRKFLFACTELGNFKQIDLIKRKRLYDFGVHKAEGCLVTFDDRYLITFERGKNKN